MPAIAREDTYRTAIDMAVSELSQLSEQMENLFVRKERLEKATDGLKHLLGVVEPRAQAGQNSGMPSGDFSPVMRFPERPE